MFFIYQEHRNFIYLSSAINILLIALCIFLENKGESDSLPCYRQEDSSSCNNIDKILQDITQLSEQLRILNANDQEFAKAINETNLILGNLKSSIETF